MPTSTYNAAAGLCSAYTYDTYHMIFSANVFARGQEGEDHARREVFPLLTPLSLGFGTAPWMQCIPSPLLLGAYAHSLCTRLYFRLVFSLRPERSGVEPDRVSGLVCGGLEFCVLSEVLPPEVDWHSTIYRFSDVRECSFCTSFIDPSPNCAPSGRALG